MAATASLRVGKTEGGATDATNAVPGTARCARLGCGAAASSSFSFDASVSLVWLDPLIGPNQGAGLLCDTHADRMTPPRGWNLQDRRGPTPRLWAERPAEPTRVVTRRERARRSRPRPAAAPLPFDDDARWSPRARPGPDLDQVLDARTPLLARAFEAARKPRSPS
ncbi:MAG TPA: DUF3499 family protein [Acidimicrobiia bacterium]